MTGDKLRVSENELDVLQDILKRDGETKTLHNNIVLQSLTYTDCQTTAMIGEYDEKYHNVYSYVHPVVAALFLPKIKLFDERMLIASLSNIVKTKYEGKQVRTKPEFELFWDLLHDKNDLVCDMESPLKDLRNRVVLQHKLWDAVFNLRQGKYFGSKLTDFMAAIGNCRNNIYDAPDLRYVKDESTILRKLLGAFSLKPTYIASSPVYNISSRNNPYVGSLSMTELDSIPMLTVRLPLNIHNVDNLSVKLTDSVSQPQWFVENNTLVPKERSILYSKDVIIFHVNRRYQSVNIGKIHSPFNFNSLPMSISSYETMNEIPVEFNDLETFGRSTYALRSAVIIEQTDIGNNKKIITGCSAGIIANNALSVGSQEVFKYHPLASTTRRELEGGNHAFMPPLRPHPWGDNNADFDDGYVSLNNQLRNKGTLFIYEKIGNDSNPYFRV